MVSCASAARIEKIPTCDGIRHGWTTETLHGKKHHLCKTVLVYPLPPGYRVLVFLHVDSLVGIEWWIIHGYRSVSPEGFIVSTSMCVGRGSSESGHCRGVV